MNPQKMLSGLYKLIPDVLTSHLPCITSIHSQNTLPQHSATQMSINL